MKLKITINMDNAAFEQPNTGAEVARILREYSEQIADAPAPGNCDGWPLTDSNGNRVGEAKVTR
jgi:hypothetical protein